MTRILFLPVLLFCGKYLELFHDLRQIQDMPRASAFANEKNFAEFFAGIGLMRLGLEMQGWTIAYANDIDPEKHEMYQAHFQDEDRHFYLGDVHDINAESVPTVALATASFPCNDLSLAGARGGLSGASDHRN